MFFVREKFHNRARSNRTFVRLRQLLYIRIYHFKLDPGVGARRVEREHERDPGRHNAVLARFLENVEYSAVT